MSIDSLNETMRNAPLRIYRMALSPGVAVAVPIFLSQP